MSKNLDTLALSLCPVPSGWDRDKDNWVRGFKAGYAEALKERKSKDMNTTEIIDNAAKEQCPPFPVKELSTNWVKGFTAGAEWATTDPEILQELLKPILVWVNRRYCLTASGNGLWYETGKIDEGRYTTEELIAKYIQFITDKQK